VEGERQREREREREREISYECQEFQVVLSARWKNKKASDAI
jgi:hypothetical protein